MFRTWRLRGTLPATRDSRQKPETETARRKVAPNSHNLPLLHSHAIVIRPLSPTSIVQQIVWIATEKRKSAFICALLLVSLPALAQPSLGVPLLSLATANQDHRDERQSERRGDNPSRPGRNFNNGLRQGGRGGQYGERGREDGEYNRRDDQNRGGIGPGKGALIGGAGGAIFGAVLGRSLKGSLVGGAAGAGIGAIIGDMNQNKRDRRPKQR